MILALTRWLLSGASVASDLAFQRMLERSAQRLGVELCLPPHFIYQLLAIEDKRFMWHPGVDPFAVLRAVIFNVGTVPSRPHGASTIAQQIYSGAARREGRWSPTLRCKIAQSFWAIRATQARSKSMVLREYLDSVYFGKSYYGLRHASIGYCGRLPSDLCIAESFFLAERIGKPNAVAVRRVAMLVARKSIMTLFRTDPNLIRDLSAHYERHFGRGKEIAKCLENSLRKSVERTSMSLEVVSNER